MNKSTCPRFMSSKGQSEGQASTVWFGAGAMFVFLALAILYPNDRLSGFAMAMKTCRAAKLYQRPLNSISVLE